MRRIFGRILEALGVRSGEGFLGGSSYGAGLASIYPGNVFKRRLECFLKDPDTYTAIISLTSLVVGPGFHISGEEEAVKIVNDFNRRVGMDQVLFEAVSEMLWAGNSFWIKVYEGGRLTGLKHIPPTSITAIHRAEDGIRGLEVQTLTGEIARIDGEKLVHFYFIRHGDEALGSPLNRPLVETRVFYDADRGAFHEIPSYYDIKWGMEWAMWRVLMKYPPRHIYFFPRLSGEAGREYAEKIKQMMPGEDIVTNQEVRVIDAKMDPRARFDSYIEYLDNKITIGLMSSILRLFTKPGFTEASAREANRIQANLVSAIQRAVKRIVERQIYYPLLESHGVDPGEADVRFNWGIPEKPRITLEDVQRFYSTPAHVEPALTRDEVRSILRGLGFPIKETSDADWKISESLSRVIVKLAEAGEGGEEKILDPRRGISMITSAGGEISTIIFDKRIWPEWSAERAEKWLRENLETLRLLAASGREGA
ncbi:MAG: hypothetical protein QXX29_00085 [Nitrososphaerota archaeon]